MLKVYPTPHTSPHRSVSCRYSPALNCHSAATHLQIRLTSIGALQHLNRLALKIVSNGSFRPIVHDKPHRSPKEWDLFAVPFMKAQLHRAQGLMNEGASIVGQVEIDSQMPRRTGHKRKDDLGRDCALRESDGMRFEVGSVCGF